MATLVNTLVRTTGGDVNNVANEQQIYYVLKLIKRTLPYLPLWEDAQKTTIPTNAGGFGTNGVIQMRKFASLPITTTPLSEGVPPDGLNLSTSTVTVSLAQYGDWIKLTDILATASIDDVMNEAMDLLAENAGRKLHQIIMNSLTGDSGVVNQVVYGGSATAGNQLTAADVMTSAQIKKAVRWLRTNNVKPYPDGYYRGILHPYQAYDLMSDSLWQDIAKYNGGAGAGGGIDLVAGEIGRIHGVRFRESTEVLVDTHGSGYSYGADTIEGTGDDSGTGANTYSSFVYGPDAFGVFDFKTQAVNNIDSETGRGTSIHSIPVNSPTKDDPLGQFGIVGWKAAFASKVIDPLRIVRIRTGATQ